MDQDSSEVNKWYLRKIENRSLEGRKINRITRTPGGHVLKSRIQRCTDNIMVSIGVIVYTAEGAIRKKTV